MSQILVGDDLHKSFGLTQALRGASIVLDEGEIVAVMGPSGSGKSTLLHCLAGMLGDAASTHSRPPRRGSRDWASTASASGYPASSPEVRASGLRWHGRWS